MDRIALITAHASLLCEQDEAFHALAPFDARDIVEMEQQQEEIYAENAWLRAAEYDEQAHIDNARF